MNEFIEVGINNSYLIMTGKLTVEELVEDNFNKLESTIFFTSPENYTTEDIDEMIEHFETTEEYEKCDELVKLKNSLEFDNFIDELARKNGVTIY